MVNCNPETSVDGLRHIDRLYFEPLTEEDVSEIVAPNVATAHCRRHRAVRGQTPLTGRRIGTRAHVPILALRGMRSTCGGS